MSIYEIITLLFSFVAILTAILSLIQSNKTSKKQIQFDEKQAQLADLQLQEIKENKEARLKADIKLSIIDDVSTKLSIENCGHSTAFNVDVKVIPSKGKESPLVDGDYNEKLPIKKLEPSDNISLILAIDGGTGTSFSCTATWINIDKSRGMKETIISL